MKKLLFSVLIVLIIIGINPVVGQSLFTKGSVWKYLDDGSNQGTDWKEIGFDDSAWSSGPAILGYGTVGAFTISTTLSYGGDSNNKYATTYFRSTFDYTPSGDEVNYIFDVLVDDAAIIYINGKEVLRIGLDVSEVNYNTFSSVGSESSYLRKYVPAGDITFAESNVIAVEVHQTSATSSDIGWDLEISSSNVPVVLPSNISQVRFGSLGDPLDGLTVTWQGKGTSDKIAWGYTSDFEEGEFEVFKRENTFGNILFDYTFPTLLADSTIYYTLFDSKDNLWIEEKIFKTASDASDNKFSFTAFGDSRSVPSEWKIISEATLETDFTLFLGDIISDGAIQSGWDDWFEYGEKFVSREILYHALGNHDEDNSPSGFDTYLDMFNLPGEETFYSFNYGNAVFICLNTEDSGNPVQYNWLLNTLEANKDKTWKFVFFHRPFYTGPSHVGEMDSYFNTWWKAFDDYGVDMTFHGHTHNYQRTKPINRNVSTTSPVASYGSGEGMGRCQIVAGGAGVGVSAAAAPIWWLEKSVSMRHFCNIDIDGDKLIMKAMDANHVVFDELVLDKSNSEITFQVDINEVTDLYDGGDVWLTVGVLDTSYVMTDTDGDGIYIFMMTEAIGSDLQYSFSYQTGPDSDIDVDKENVPAECSDAEGYRSLNVPYGNFILPPVLYGTCNEAPKDITFQVDLSYITDLYEGGAVWLTFSDLDTSYLMTDIDGDGIYTYTVPLIPGADLKYFFSYQNGASPEVDYVEESVPFGCADAEGYRFLKVPDNPISLLAVMFSFCIEDPGPQPTITIPITASADDAEEFASAVGGEVVGEVGLTSSDLEICFDSENQYVGMLFRDVQIPVGATVTNAYVQFTVDAVDGGVATGAITVDVYGAKEASVAAITETPFNISSHPKTALVSWSPGASVAVGDAGVNEQTPDISTVINEIIAVDGWAAGNNMLIVVHGNDAQTANINREMEAYDGDPAGAPQLNVTFTIGSTTAVNEIDAHFTSRVYPNPTEGTLNIENPSLGEFSYSIYSITGKLVGNRNNITDPVTKVDIHSFNSGMYFVKVQSAETTKTHKVILK